MSGPALCWSTSPALAISRPMEGLAMTTKHPAYDSSLYRDVNDALAAAVLIMFAVMILLVAP